jgi:hypothetical protein
MTDWQGMNTSVLLTVKNMQTYRQNKFPATQLDDYDLYVINIRFMKKNIN